MARSFHIHIFTFRAYDHRACTVSAPSGQFRGLVQKSVLMPDVEYCSYRGIPYARPPVGELRFRVRRPSSLPRLSRTGRGPPVRPSGVLCVYLFTTYEKLYNYCFQQNPVPLNTYLGVYDALADGNECLQGFIVDQTLIGSEDCLYLNVYTPKVSFRRRGLTIS